MSRAAVAVRPPAAGVPALPPALVDLLRELGELKRVRSAGREGSVARRLFAEAWARLVAGQDPREAALAVTARALVAARLGDLDAAALVRAGLPPGAVRAVFGAALAAVAEGLDAGLAADLARALDLPPPPPAPPPAFVAALAAQPRAGVTCPGRPRLLLEPPEDHAEHSVMVALYGVLLAPSLGADPADVFLAGLAHHLHNALLPDSGFTGEMLLGDHLLPAMARATDLALAELAPDLRAAAVAARDRALPDAATPEGRAFHAADTLDRVLQIDQHLRAGRTTLGFVLRDMALVHDGPVKAYQDRVLAEAGLLA